MELGRQDLPAPARSDPPALHVPRRLEFEPELDLFDQALTNLGLVTRFWIQVEIDSGTWSCLCFLGRVALRRPGLGASPSRTSAAPACRRFFDMGALGDRLAEWGSGSPLELRAYCLDQQLVLTAGLAVDGPRPACRLGAVLTVLQFPGPRSGPMSRTSLSGAVGRSNA